MNLRLDPTSILSTWKTFADKPFGKQLVSRAVGLMAPYTGSISPQILEISPGHARVQMRDRWGVRNHLRSLHAVALMNLGEACTGLAVHEPRTTRRSRHRARARHDLREEGPRHDHRRGARGAARDPRFA